MAAFAPIAVVGGPLRTGRASAIDRVIRIQQAPHGALNGGALIDAVRPGARHRHLDGDSRHHRRHSRLDRAGRRRRKSRG